MMCTKKIVVIFAIAFQFDSLNGQNTPIGFFDQLRNVEHYQNFALLRNLQTRSSQESNLPKSNVGPKNPTEVIQQQKNPLQNSNAVQIQTQPPTTVQPQVLTTPEPNPVQRNPNIVQQFVPSLHHFTSLHPNSLSGFNGVRVPYPYNAVRVPHPVPVPVHIKVPVTVEKPYPFPVTKTIAVPVEKPIYVMVPQPIQVPVAQPYPVLVPRPVEVRVPQPVYIRVLPNGQQYVVNSL